MDWSGWWGNVAGGVKGREVDGGGRVSSVMCCEGSSSPELLLLLLLLDRVVPMTGMDPEPAQRVHWTWQTK